MPTTVGDLARHAKVSEPTFARRFLAETGTTPVRWLATQRLAVARELLEDGTLSVEEIARRCGLGGTDNLRLYFRRHLRTTPSAYRRAFCATAADHAWRRGAETASEGRADPGHPQRHAPS
jgi:transcriptional regulator GlxA family with amidase domain